ncbi:MAG: hypothetical protein AB3N64_06445 [Puniceicoccaceae bacterium]
MNTKALPAISVSGMQTPQRSSNSIIDAALTVGGVVCMLFSLLLVAVLPLDAISPVAFAPVFFFTVGCMLGNNKSFFVGLIMASLLATIGSSSLEAFGHSEIATREFVYSFGTFRLGFLNLGIGNMALVLSGLFVARNYSSQLDLSIRIFILPGLLVIFSAVQYLVYPGYLTITISNRSTIVFLFVAIAVANLKLSPHELRRYIEWILLFMCIYSAFMFLRYVGSYSGRGHFLVSMMGLPLCIYMFRTRNALNCILGIIPFLAVVDGFLFSTYWTKLMILTSIGSMIILPLIQRNKLLFWVFPIISVALPLSAIFVEPSEDLKVIFSQTIQNRDSDGSIGDLTEYQLQEVIDLVMAKYKAERVPIWKSSLKYNFSELSLLTVLPDPASFFTYENGSISILWLNGPHHAFLLLLRVYGIFAGGLIFGLICYLLYQAISVPIPGMGPVGAVFQPFLLTFAVIGFHIGDYPLNSSAGFILFLVLGITLAAKKISHGRIAGRRPMR